jgi:hypothetical protein
VTILLVLSFSVDASTISPVGPRTFPLLLCGSRVRFVAFRTIATIQRTDVATANYAESADRNVKPTSAVRERNPKQYVYRGGMGNQYDIIEGPGPGDDRLFVSLASPPMAVDHFSARQHTRARSPPSYVPYVMHEYRCVRLGSRHGRSGFLLNVFIFTSVFARGPYDTRITYVRRSRRVEYPRTEVKTFERARAHRRIEFFK